MTDKQESRWWTHGITEDKEHPWRYYRWFVHDRQDRLDGRIEWSLFRRPSFGWGFQFGHNGSESDIGLDLHAGRIGSVWLRLRSPWTKWAKIEKQGDDDREWYKVRHYGVRLRPFAGRWISIEIAARDGEWSRDEPWYRHIDFGATQIWGRQARDRTEVDNGECEVPMPEGSYPATWSMEQTRRRFVRWPGRLRNRWQSTRTSVKVDIPGCIPVWGKGENSWDCGMDGVCGTYGATVEEAVANAVQSALSDRKRYGGPDDLPRPMSIRDAEQWHANTK